jgi:hypothetical protein
MTSWLRNQSEYLVTKTCFPRNASAEKTIDCGHRSMRTRASRTRSSLPLRALLCLALAMGCLSVLASGDDGPQRWVTTWATANAASERPATFSNQTIREIVHTTIGGSAVRIVFSNTFGVRAIRLDAVFVGLQNGVQQKDEAALVPRSNHQVTFGGSRSITIPEGADVLSDPVSLSVGSQQDLVISLFTSGETGPATAHWLALQTNYVSGAGNFAAEESADAFVTPMGSWYFLSAVEVLAPASAKGGGSTWRLDH